LRRECFILAGRSQFGNSPFSPTTARQSYSSVAY
jgi:hypothetical protein